MREMVVVLHGLWMTGFESALLRRRLERDGGFETRRFFYHTVRHGIEESVERLHRAMEKLPSEVIHLVGHSLGGLLALRAVEGLDGGRPGRVVCLGSPLRGSVTARSLAHWPGGPGIMGRTVGQAVLTGVLEEYRGEREVGVIAGTKSVGLGRIVHRNTAPNDGVIALTETELPGITDHLQLRISHTGMLLSPEVARQVARFLRDGSFQHADPKHADPGDGSVPRRNG